MRLSTNLSLKSKFIEDIHQNQRTDRLNLLFLSKKSNQTRNSTSSSLNHGYCEKRFMATFSSVLCMNTSSQQVNHDMLALGCRQRCWKRSCKQVRSYRKLLVAQAETLRRVDDGCCSKHGYASSGKHSS